MLENDLFRGIKEVLTAGMAAQGQSSVIITQAYQPTNQGIPEQPALYVFKIGNDRRIGHPERKDEWVPADPSAVPPVLAHEKHTETTWYESDFQISATSIKNPKDTAPLTAGDLANLAAGIMQGNAAMDGLRARGIGILRVREVRNTPFIDDKARFETNPSFDFTLTHEQVIISSVPYTDIAEFQLKRI